MVPSRQGLCPGWLVFASDSATGAGRGGILLGGVESAALGNWTARVPLQEPATVRTAVGGVLSPGVSGLQGPGLRASNFRGSLSQ